VATGAAGENQEQHDYIQDRKIPVSQTMYLSMAELSYPLYKKLFGDREHFVRNVEDDLAEANINTTVEVYLSAALTAGVVGGLGLGFLLTLGVYALVFFLGGIPTVILGGLIPLEWIPLAGTAAGEAVFTVAIALKWVIFLLVAGLVFSTVGAVVSLGLALAYPSRVVAYQRQRQIELVLPDVVAFMYSLSVGGMNQLQIFEAVAESQDTYGEVAVEFRRIHNEMMYFNTDYKTAIEQVAETTPSDDLGRFLTDLLSVINSGGDMATFLETQKDFYMDEVKRSQEKHLETLEFFGEMYMSLSILPMVLLIILVIMALLGTPQTSMLVMTVYFLLPFLNLMFIVTVSIVQREEVGDGTLAVTSDGEQQVTSDDDASVLSSGAVGQYREGDADGVFDQIRSMELRHRISRVAKNPVWYLTENPRYVLPITVPVTIAAWAVFAATGVAGFSLAALKADPILQTVVWFYTPVMVNLLPMTVFYELRQRTKGQVTDTLTDDLRKVANANATGQPLLEAFRIASEDKPSRLGDELGKIYSKVKFGGSLGPALVEFNNKYQVPRLARVTKLIQRAQEASSEISQVLETAATVSENQDELQRERIARTRMQVAVIAVTFLVFLAVILMLQEFFVAKMTELVGGSSGGQAVGGTTGGGGGFNGIQAELLKVLYFHATTLQAVCAGVVCGYMQSGKIRTSYKYIIAYMLINLTAWLGVAVAL
jgi:flagellar protein FlaJ